MKQISSMKFGRGLMVFLGTLICLGMMNKTYAQNEKVLSVDTTEGIKSTFDRSPTRSLQVIPRKDGNVLELKGSTIQGKGNHYFGIMIPLGRTWDFTKSRLELDARTSQPQNTAAFYVRAYNQGESKPSMSFNSWNNVLKSDWKTFGFQSGESSLPAETAMTEGRKPVKVDRLEFIIGSSGNGVPIDLQIRNVRTAPRVIGLDEISAPRQLMRTIPVVENGAADAVILYPGNAAGKSAAQQIAQAVKDKTGVPLKMRAGTAADREFDENVIMVGNVFNNPAMLLLYARQFTPVDALCPGAGGYLVQTVHDPFGNGHGAIVVGASDDAGLKKAADAFVARIAKAKMTSPKVLSFPKFFDAGYSKELLRHQSWLQKKPDPKVIENGLKTGQNILDTGKHTSIAGLLKTTALHYQLSPNGDDAKLFVALWDLYAKSAVADASKFGGPWGFDSDFPSFEVVCGWDNIEEDPALTDAGRLRVTKEMARWLREAVVPKASMTPGHVTFNHQTFPALGTFRAGLYFSQAFPEIAEGKRWLAQGDRVFENQEKYFKSHEDCNTYQWLTIKHTLRYALARPNFSIFENGNAERIAAYCMGTMNNLGFQVPYGDTGVWNATYGELIPMNMIAFATGNKTARWLATEKQKLYKSHYLYEFQGSQQMPVPSGFDGVKMLPLEPAYVNTFPVTPRPADNQLFDKISFREAVNANSPYILLDGLNNGGHGHRDGNSIEQLTQYDRVWLADNDYYKSQAKYHNTLLILHNGQASELPAYVALLGHGEKGDFGYSHTQLANYSNANWDRYVIWLKDEQAFVVLDKVTALEDGEFQCRLLWHGVGDVKVTDEGMLLQQQGPSMWFQIGKGPQLKLTNDRDLGRNWNSYQYADPIVRSLGATSRVDLQKGQHYLFATVIHGKAGGVADAWKLNYLNGYNGVQLATDQQTLNLQIEGNKLALQNVPGVTTFTEPQSVDASKSTFNAGAKIADTAIAPPVKNGSTQYQAAAFRQSWSINPRPQEALLTGNIGQPGATKTPAALSSNPAPRPGGNVLISSANQLDDLLKGTPVMFPPDKTVQLIIDLHHALPLSQVQWQQWWAKTSSKGTAYLLDHAIVEISNDNFAKDVRKLGEVQGGRHPDWGSPIPYEVKANGAAARYVRITLVPQPGSAIYLADIAVRGPLGNAQTSNVPFTYTQIITAQLQKAQPKVLLASTREGVLLAISPQGKMLWSKKYPTQLNGVAAGDINGDGIDEIGLARQDGNITVLDGSGNEIWNAKLAYYRESPYVNLIRMADLDGDGKDEVVVGAQNWRFYAFSSEGKELWQYEVVHASTAGAVDDLNGDGKQEVIAGTHYYSAMTLSDTGKLLWRLRFKSPICYDIATGNFDGNKTRGVVFGAGDGNIYYTDSAGKVRTQFNTGDEVKHVSTADLDGDGRDEFLAASDNGYLYCFGADGKLRWLRQLGNATTALETMKLDGRPAVVAGTANGAVLAFDANGKVIRKADLPAAIQQFAVDNVNLIVASADGRVLGLKE